MPPSTCGIALSPTHLVGFAGPCYAPGQGYVWRAERSGAEIAKEVEEGPPLRTEAIFFRDMKTWGDFVMLDVGRKLLVRMTDWETRWLTGMVEDGVFPQAETLTEDHLYVTYVKVGNVRVEPYTLNGLRLLQSFRRYELSKFDQLGEPECGTEEGSCRIAWDH